MYSHCTNCGRAFTIGVVCPCRDASTAAPKRNRWGWEFATDEANARLRRFIHNGLCWLCVLIPILFTIWVVNR